MPLIHFCLNAIGTVHIFFLPSPIVSDSTGQHWETKTCNWILCKIHKSYISILGGGVGNAQKGKSGLEPPNLILGYILRGFAFLEKKSVKIKFCHC